MPPIQATLTRDGTTHHVEIGRVFPDVPNRIYRKNLETGEYLEISSWPDSIKSQYYKFKGKDLEYTATVPRQGKTGKFDIELFSEYDPSWCRRRIHLIGHMNENGDIIQLIENLSSDGHGHIIPNLDAINEIIRHRDWYPKQISEIARKCLEFIKKMKK